MSEIKFECPHCRQHLQCDETFSGREIQCPKCGHLLRIPAVPGKTADYQPEAGRTWDTFGPSVKAVSPEGLRIHRDGRPPRSPGQ